MAKQKNRKQRLNFCFDREKEKIPQISAHSYFVDHSNLPCTKMRITALRIILFRIFQVRILFSLIRIFRVDEFQFGV